MLQKWKMQFLSFGFGFTTHSRLFHLFRADRKSEVVDENRSTRRKSTWPSAAELGVSYVTRARREPRNAIHLPFSAQPSLRYIWDNREKAVNHQSENTFTCAIH